MNKNIIELEKWFKPEEITKIQNAELGSKFTSIAIMEWQQIGVSTSIGGIDDIVLPKNENSYSLKILDFKKVDPNQPMSYMEVEFIFEKQPA